MKRKLRIAYGVIAMLTIATPVVVSQTTAQSPDGQSQLNVSVKVDRDADVKRLVERIKKTEIDEETKSALRTELMQELLTQFAEMESERKQQIEVIEKRIQNVKATLEMRAQNAEKIVENRISQLLGEPSSLSWDYAIPDEKQSALSQGTRELALDRNLSWLQANQLLRATQSKADDNSPRKKASIDADEAKNRASNAAKAATSKKEALDANLLLGYGLALTTFEEKRKAFEESLAKKKELEAVVSEAEARASIYAKQLNGEKMNDPILSTRYRETISQVEEKMRKVEELMKSLQSQKRELSILELELLPLKNEVERIYGEEATSKPVD